MYGVHIKDSLGVATLKLKSFFSTGWTIDCAVAAAFVIQFFNSAKRSASIQSSRCLGLRMSLFLVGSFGLSPVASAQVTSERQSLSDAWWTGPMLANSAETLPLGRALFETYLYNVHTASNDSYGTLTYALYGLTDRVTVGVIPAIGFNRPDNGRSSNGIALGDVNVQAQYRLRQFHEGSWLPTVALMLKQTLPTGRYDNLGTRPSNGLGSGVMTTTIGLNTQTYLWMPSGRILRLRFNTQVGFSGSTVVKGVSVYGTPETFVGQVSPGRAFLFNTSLEYSLSKRWVVALDAIYSHNEKTRVHGASQDKALAVQVIDSNLAFALAPAIEYSWKPNIGVLVGTRVVLSNQRTPGSVTPTLALNYVH
jgi:hypothetical protein